MIAPCLRAIMGCRKRCVSSTSDLTFRSIMFSSRARSSLLSSPIEPNPALLISMSTVNPRLVASANNCAGASGLLRSSATYCARMLLERPSSLQRVTSFSSERATNKTLRPRAASLRAKTSPMPLDAPVMRVVFIVYLLDELADFQNTQLNNIRTARTQAIQYSLRWRFIKIDARHGRFRPVENYVLHLLHVDVFALDRIEHRSQHAGTIQMPNNQPVRSGSLSGQISTIGDVPCFFNLAHNPHRFRGNRFLS